MAVLDEPQERCWFVIVTAPLVFGTLPLMLELFPVVGDLNLSHLMSDVVMFGLYLAGIGLAGAIGVVAAPPIHDTVDLHSSLGHAVDIDRTMARAMTIVFGLFVLAMTANFATFVFAPGTNLIRLATTLSYLPFIPWFLYPVLSSIETSSVVGWVAITVIGATTGVWQVFLGFVVGKVFKRITLVL